MNNIIHPQIRSNIYLFFFLLFSSCTLINIGAQSDPMGYCSNPQFDKEVAKYIAQTVPVISCDQLNEIKNSGRQLIILDTREPHEYEVSHIPGAINVGYDNFDINNIPDIPISADVVVYCSIGYRSEKIGEKLLDNGIQKVHNLYGSIFEWANSSYPLQDIHGNATSEIHTYNENWSQWVDGKKVKKIW